MYSLKAANKRKQLPKIMMANTRSAVLKLENIYSVIDKLHVDCFVACETWFSNQHSEDFTSFPGFSTFRCDRKGRIGGGVAIWSRGNLCVSPIIIHNVPAEIEMVGIVIRPDICLFGLYIPPVAAMTSRNELTDFFINCFEDALHRYNAKHIVVAGDLNHFPMTEVCSNLDLESLYTGSTYGNPQLDYILVSSDLTSEFYATAELPFENSKTFHRSLLATPKSHTVSFDVKVSKFVYDLRSSNVSRFVNLLQQSDWSPLHDPLIHIDEKCEFFHYALSQAFSLCIPCRKVTLSSNDKPWMIPLLKSLVDQPWEAYRERSFPRYRHFQKKVKEEIIKAKKIWLNKATKTNIWKLAKTSSGKMHSGNLSKLFSLFLSRKAAADTINHSFLQNHKESRKEDSNIPPPSVLEDAYGIRVSEAEVFYHLCHLKTKKASPDIPVVLYKAAAHMICKPLCLLFKESLTSCYVPSQRKSAIVTPIFKTKNAYFNQLRPVSMFPIPIKILETIILQAIKKEVVSAYGFDQFEFHRKSSTGSALISLHEYYTKCLEDSRTTGVQLIAFDFAKAFDKLNHEVIISRLQECGFSVSIVCWIRSFLVGRKQAVRVGGVMSDFAAVGSGVPQGSVLAPYLFSLVSGSFHLHDILAKVVKYAADFTICVPIFRNGINEHVSAAHAALLSWSDEVGLPLNLSKCKILPIPRTKDFSPICLNSVTVVDELKLLGVTFDRKNNWSRHVDLTVRSSSRNLFLVRSLRDALTPTSLVHVYNSYVRSILEYCSPLFIGLSKENCLKLERVQKRFYRFLSSTCNSPTYELFVPLSERRKVAALKLFRQAMATDHILNSQMPHFSMSGRAILPAVRNERRLRTFSSKCAIVLNEEHVRK